MNDAEFDVIVAGAGPAGLAAACLIKLNGRRVALIAGKGGAAIDDPRTVALMQPAIRLLDFIGVWPGSLRNDAAPLKKLRLLDDTGAFFRAPEISFDSRELGDGPFGWNIPIARLVPALVEKTEGLGVAQYRQDARDFSADLARATVTLDDGRTLHAPLVVAADGRNSRIRQAARISARDWAYDQSAIATSFSHSEPHFDISTEYHKPAGPFTTVPLPGNRSSLVWMEKPGRVAELMRLDDGAFASEIQLATHGDMGRIDNIGPRRAFPMQGLSADRLAGNRLILMGEAAHVVPPIGAQGLNMSLRDAAEIADLIARHADPGSRLALGEYEASRRGDIMPRQAVIDLMNRSLLAGGSIWLDGGRATGIAAIAALPPLRQFVMRRGLIPPGRLPTAMQGRNTAAT